VSRPEKGVKARKFKELMPIPCYSLWSSSLLYRLSLTVSVDRHQVAPCRAGLPLRQFDFICVAALGNATQITTAGLRRLQREVPE